jgi:cytochrome P450
VLDIVRRRRTEVETAADLPQDLLARLLAARDPETGEPMDDDRLVDNLLTLLEAGHETTAKALTWSLYLLSRAPEWQDRIREEVRAIAGDSPLTSDHVEHLPVTSQILKEALRLYPPAPVMMRMPTRDVDLAGHELPAGSFIIIPIFALHRHRMLWADPDRFAPERFTPEFEENLARTQYMPFGAGPRICLGMSFAMVEAKVLLATLVRGARFSWDGCHAPEPISRITLRPKGGMPVIVEPL